LTAASTPNGIPITTAINMAAKCKDQGPGSASVNTLPTSFFSLIRFRR
jgi:hypothetical protein